MLLSVRRRFVHTVVFEQHISEGCTEGSQSMGAHLHFEVCLLECIRPIIFSKRSNYVVFLKTQVHRKFDELVI